MKFRYTASRRSTLLMVAAAGAAVGQPQTYAIRMTPPVQAGKIYAATLTGRKIEKATSGDRVLKEADYQIGFEGRARVVDVDSRARPIRMVFTVGKFQKLQAGVTVDLLKEGTIIVADDRQHPSISLEDGPMDESLVEAFGLVYASHKPDDPTDDDVLGTKEAKNIGQKWSIDQPLALQSLKDKGILVPADRLSGTFTLKARDKIGNVDCLSVSGELLAEGISTAKLPPGVTASSGSFKATLRGCFPIEPMGLVHSESTDLSMELHLSQAPNDVDGAILEMRDAVWTLLAK